MLQGRFVRQVMWASFDCLRIEKHEFVDSSEHGQFCLGCCVGALPADPGAERVMRGVAQEVRESEGTAHLVRGALVGAEAALVATFNAARDEEYREVLDRCHTLHAELEKERKAGKFTFAELEENEEDLAKLEAWMAKVHARDRFGAPLAQEAKRALEACREDLEAFVGSVYDAADHGSAGPAAT